MEFMEKSRRLYYISSATRSKTTFFINVRWAVADWWWWWSWSWEDANEDDNKDTEIMTTIRTTIIMTTMVRHRRWRRQLWRRWRRRFWCRSRSGWQVIPKGWDKRAPKFYIQGSGRKPLFHGRQNPGGQIRGEKIRRAKSGQRIWNSEIQTPTRGKIRRAKSGQDFWARKSKHPRVAKSGGTSSGQRIWNSEIQTPIGGQKSGGTKSWTTELELGNQPPR